MKYSKAFAIFWGAHIVNDDVVNTAEIKYMRRAGKVLSNTLAKLQRVTEPGITTAELR